MIHYIVHKSNRKKIITITSINQIKVVDYDMARPDEGRSTEGNTQKD